MGEETGRNLFEHQSRPQKWMRYRVLKYKCRIWDESFRESPKQKGLVPILPVVFYLELQN